MKIEQPFGQILNKFVMNLRKNMIHLNKQKYLKKKIKQINILLNKKSSASKRK